VLFALVVVSDKPPRDLKKRANRTETLANPTRRRLLAAGALGGSALLGGCFGLNSDSDETPDAAGGDGDTDGGDQNLSPDTPAPGTGTGSQSTTESTPSSVYVEGQTLRIPTRQNPDEMHFVWRNNLHHGIESKYDAADDVFWATHEPGFWGRWFHQTYWTDPGDIYPQMFEQFEFEDDYHTISVKIKDDTYWSDGEPIRAYDAVAMCALWSKPTIPSYPEETRISGYLRDYTMPEGPDGKVFKYHTAGHPDVDTEYPEVAERWREIDGFQSLSIGEILYYIGGHLPRASVYYPTHLDPVAPLFEEAMKLWDEKNHDLSREEEREVKPDRGELVEKHLDGVEFLEWSRKPENFVSSGVWTLDEIRGTKEVVLAKNDHHRHADDVNYDSVVLEYSESPQRIQAGLSSGQYDYASVTTPPETAESFPDSITEITSPGGGGYAFGIDHSHSFFGDVRIRQAIMYALDTEAIANNIHPTAVHPIHTPGWDTWAAEAIFDEDWAMENLITYEQDLDRAAELMRSAGCELVDGVWHKDGEPFQTRIATYADTPRFEVTAESQLQEAGIDISVQSYDQAIWQDRVTGSDEAGPIEEEYGAKGDFDIWTGDGWDQLSASFYDQMVEMWWKLLSRAERVRQRNFYSHEVQEGATSHPEWDGQHSGYNDAPWQNFTMDISPIGQPDAERTFTVNPRLTWSTVRVGPATYRDPQPDNPYYNPPDDQPSDANGEYFYQYFAWVLNWWLPVMPVALGSDQHFMNTANWNWPTDQDMWDYFGLNWDAEVLASLDLLEANPDNPKEGANVVER